MNTEIIRPLRAFKPNPLLAHMLPGNPTPGNWSNSVWYATDFKPIPFNGTRQLMRAGRKSLGVYVATSPRYKTKDGATFVRTKTGQIVRTSPRQFPGTRRVRGLASV